MRRQKLMYRKKYRVESKKSLAFSSLQQIEEATTERIKQHCVEIVCKKRKPISSNLVARFGRWQTEL